MPSNKHADKPTTFQRISHKSSKSFLPISGIIGMQARILVCRFVATNMPSSKHVQPPCIYLSHIKDADLLRTAKQKVSDAIRMVENNFLYVPPPSPQFHASPRINEPCVLVKGSNSLSNLGKLMKKSHQYRWWQD